jgi:2-amino-4-hydroxy-6-hydroxymethyldihydropteridine diphosphokinase
LGLGSNLGDRAANLLRAISVIVSADLTLSAVSSIYETEPVDYLDQPRFLNMVVAVGGESLEPFSLLDFCLEAEAKLGRRRAIPSGARTIDIDLLMFDDLVVDHAGDGADLTLPHPRLHVRRFVLTPMAEIAPRLRHPVLGKTMSQLLGALDDSSEVRVYLESDEESRENSGVVPGAKVG